MVALAEHLVRLAEHVAALGVLPTQNPNPKSQTQRLHPHHSRATPGFWTWFLSPSRHEARRLRQSVKEGTKEPKTATRTRGRHSGEDAPGRQRLTAGKRRAMRRQSSRA